MKSSIIVIVNLLTALGAVAAIDHNPKIWQEPAFQKAFMGSYGMRAEIEPSISAVEREDMEEIMQLMADEEKPEKSVAKAKKMLNKNLTEASSAIFDFTVANMAFQDDNQEEALKHYKNAVGKFPSFQRAWKNMGLIYVQNGNYSAAIRALTRAIELGSIDGYSFGLLAYSYFSTENYLSSESAYRQAMLFQPKSMDWKLGLLRCLYKQRKYAEVSAMCEELITGNPEKIDYWLMRANAFLGMNKPMKAAEIYELLALEDKASAQVLTMLGDIYINEQKYEMAAGAYIAAVEKSEQVDPSRVVRNCEVLLARGAYAETKKLMQALNDVAADRLDDEVKKRILKMEARIAANEGMTEDQHAEILKRIIKLDPLDGEALILLGQYYGRNDKVEDAVFCFERAVGIEKFEADACLRHGQLLVKNGRYDESLVMLKRSVEIKPRDDVQRYIEQVERVARRKALYRN
ncbi:MAG: tetratricopeptide repeat protein [Kiritimatiellia bacterium]